MEIMGIRIPTVVKDVIAVRCDGCGEVIRGTPWRLNILDIVTAEAPVSWDQAPAINPGPFQFHSDSTHVRTWMRRKGHLFCRRGIVREIMRPVPIPAARGGGPVRYGLCDGLHHDEHEFIPA